jgi:NitT/TauT family transport system substrate-binding protein
LVAIAASVALARVFDFPGLANRAGETAPATVKLVLGVPPVPSFANVILAHQLGFFRDAGLDVTIKGYPTGALAFADMLAGKIDIALTADTPVALLALKGERFELLATTFEAGDFLKMIARRDRGIAKASDLAGKKLGATFGTTAEFTQDSILAVYRVDPAKITRVNLAPARTVDALLAAEVDAVTIWAPYSRDLIERLGETAIVIGDNTISLTTINIVAAAGTGRRRPDATRRMLAAIVRATAFIHADPDRASRVVAQVLGLSESTVRADLVPANFTVALNQSLIILLEDQARWAIKRRLVEAREVPNFLELISADALATVRPEAVSVIR